MANTYLKELSEEVSDGDKICDEVFNRIKEIGKMGFWQRLGLKNEKLYLIETAQDCLKTNYHPK